MTMLSPVYDDLLDFLVEKATPQEILSFAPSESSQQRAEDLLERSSEGALSPEESAELDQMLQVDRFISVLKARALNKLSQQ